MFDRPQIERLRVLHDLQTQFDVPEAIRSTLESQLAPGDQDRVDRFIRGFRIEDWFEWTFSTLPWVKLIHTLDQQQFPSRSKDEYQVPDFLLLVEASDLKHKPLLADVKLVAAEKRTLKLQESQCALSERYAAATGNATPSENGANMSANVIVDLMRKLECPELHMFPTDRTEELKRLDATFKA